jgi:hypothetical protein
MEGFRELHNNTVPKKHDSQNNTPLNITPLTHVSDGLYIECPPRGMKLARWETLEPSSTPYFSPPEWRAVIQRKEHLYRIVHATERALQKEHCRAGFTNGTLKGTLRSGRL